MRALRWPSLTRRQIFSLALSFVAVKIVQARAGQVLRTASAGAGQEHHVRNSHTVDCSPPPPLCAISAHLQSNIEH